MDNMLTIFRWDDDSESMEVKNAIKKLVETNNINVREDFIDAYAGTLSGTVIDLFVSKPIQATVTAYTLFNLFKDVIELIKALKSNKKEFKVGKRLAEMVAIFKHKDLCSKYNIEIEDVIILESALIEEIGGCLTEETMNNVLDATIDNGYLIAIGIPIENETIKVIWNIINTRGEIKVTWITKKCVKLT